MPVSDPDVSRPRLVRDATFLEADRREIALRRGPHNQLGFAYQVAFVRVLGRFPQQTPLEIDGEILRFAALQLGADAETIHAYASRQQTVSEHQQRIGEYLRLRAFDAAAGERLARFLKDEALRLERTASLLARARAWLRDEHVLAPSDSVLRRAIGAARHKARTLLTQRMAERLSAPMREGLDALVAVDDDQPHSPLNRIKASSSNPSVGGMKRLLARLELIEATGVLGVDVDWVNGNYQRILFHSVRTASADRVRRMAAPRRHLALVCFLHQTWRDTLDQAVDMYGKLLDRNRKLVETRLDDMLKAQRQAVDRIVHRYRQLGAVLLDPDVGDDELRVRLLSTVPEAQLREDQSDLANWTRGDRKARFEQTAERHAGLSQFAGPFLSRMKFVDEQGEGTSATLSALRAYREHRAAGRRGVPPHAPLDFAPAALQLGESGTTRSRRHRAHPGPQRGGRAQGARSAPAYPASEPLEAGGLHHGVTGLGGGRCGCHATAAPAAGGVGAEPVPLEGGLGERPGLAEAVVGRLVESGVERARPAVSVSVRRPSSKIIEGCKAAADCLKCDLIEVDRFPLIG